MQFGARLKTEGERRLARYFTDVHRWREGRVWEYEPDLPGKVKRPDFLLAVGGHVCMLEVKDFGEDIEELPLTRRASNPYSRIRAKIEDGRRQFREFRDDLACGLVLRPGPTSDTDVRDPVRVMRALLGHPFSASPRNTTLAAVLTVRRRVTGDDDRRALGISVHENPDARVPFPTHLFDGPYDEWWRRDGRGIRRVFRGKGLEAAARRRHPERIAC